MKYTRFHVMNLNRRRALRWHSYEDRLLGKYGTGGSRYRKIYVTEPEELAR